MDGDWTAETRHSFAGCVNYLPRIDKLIKNGSQVYPWPSQRSPADNWKRAALRRRNMTEWVDPNQNKWKDIAQTTVNVHDQESDIPNEPSDLFTVTANDSDSDSFSESEVSTQEPPDELTSSSQE